MKLFRRFVVLSLILMITISFMPSLAFAEDVAENTDDVSVISEELEDVEEQTEENLDIQNDIIDSIDETELEEQSEPEVFETESESEVSGIEEGIEEDAVTDGEQDAEGENDDTEPDVIEISTLTQLRQVKNDLAGNYKLVADIDLSGTSSWTPIGASSPFSGVFDGNGYEIVGLKISESDTSYEGLFGVNSGTIKNLTVRGGTVSGNEGYGGGIVGLNRGVIDSCKNYNEVNMIGTATLYAGGITASNTGTLKNCENHASVTMMAITTSSSSIGISSTIGGITGKNEGTIESCLNSGEMTSLAGKSFAYAGGIAGTSSKKGVAITKCENTGSIWASVQDTSTAYGPNAGGIVGYQSSGSNVSDCINSGNVSSVYKSGNAHAGGISGFASGSKITNSLNSGTILASSEGKTTASYSGGIAGWISNDSVTYAVSNCANEGTVTSSSVANTFAGGITGSIKGGINKSFNLGLIAANTDVTSGCTLLSGGITGAVAEGTIANSFNRGTVSSVGNSRNSAYTGGIAGLNGDTLKQCYNSGKLTAINIMGGIVGANTGTLSDCYNAGTIITTDGSTYYGGIAGQNGSKGVINNVYSVGTLKGTRSYGGSLVGIHQGTATGSLIACDLGYLYTVNNGERIGQEYYLNELEDPAVFTDFDFSSVWKMGEGTYKLPVLATCTQADAQSNISIPIEGIYLQVFNPEIEYDGDLKKPIVFAAGLKVHVSYEISGGAVNAGNATVTVEGISPVTGSVEMPFKIIPKSVTPKIKLSKTSYVYNGKNQTPSVTVTCAGEPGLTSGDYTVTMPSDKKSVGAHSISVKLKGNYKGSAKASYNIVPKGTTLSKLTATKKGFTAKWKVQKTQTTGYQIQYSLKSSFSGSKTVTVSKNSTTSKAVTKLKAKKKYYVRIRTYKTVSGKKYYSAWSKTKTVTTKK